MAGETSLLYAPVEYENISEVVVYVPRILKTYVKEDQGKIVIQWVDVNDNDNLGR